MQGEQIFPSTPRCIGAKILKRKKNTEKNSEKRTLLKAKANHVTRHQLSKSKRASENLYKKKGHGSSQKGFFC